MEKVAIVTGATRGIGNAVAKRLAGDGCYIIATGTAADGENQPGIKGLKEKAGKFLYVPCNIGVKEERENLVSKAEEAFGHIDILVNNAGVAPPVRKDILETNEDNFDFLMNINLKGTFFLTQLVANRMISYADKKCNPIIINISSMSAYTSSVSRGEYCISKAGISMMTKLFADRLAEYGIFVYEIMPGIIKTDMTSKVTEKYDRLIEGGLLPVKRWGTPEDVACAAGALCRGEFLYSTGEVINVDGGFHLRRL